VAWFDRCYLSANRNGPVTVVRAVHATPLERRQAFSEGELRAMLDDLRLGVGDERRRLLDISALLPARPPHDEVATAAIRAQIGAAFATGDLLALPGWAWDDHIPREQPLAEPKIELPWDQEAPPEQLWVEFQVADAAGNPVGGMSYRLLVPQAPQEEGTLPSSGRLRKDGVRAGTYTLELGMVVAVDWLVDGQAALATVPADTALTLSAGFIALAPGTPVRFEVFRLYEEEADQAVASLDAQVDARGAATAAFTFAPEEGERGRVDLIVRCAADGTWMKSRPLGLLIPRLAGARWGSGDAWVGDELSLAVQCPGVPDGEAVTFEIRKSADDAVVTSVEGKAAGGVAGAIWASVDPSPDESETELYFVAKYRELTISSRPLVLLDRVELVFKSPSGGALAHMHLTLVYEDGTTKNVTSDGEGRVRLTDSRARKAQIRVGGMDESAISLVNEADL
jgi:hypothetical protein